VTCRVGPLPFHVALSSRAVLDTPEEACVAPLLDAVCCLRRDMTGSASSPFRAFMSRGCKVHAFAFGPRLCSLRAKPYSSGQAFDAPLRRLDLSSRPGPATRRCGAYRGGTSTRKFDTAQRPSPSPLAAAPGPFAFGTHHEHHPTQENPRVIPAGFEPTTCGLGTRLQVSQPTGQDRTIADYRVHNPKGRRGRSVFDRTMAVRTGPDDIELDANRHAIRSSTRAVG
jgi:hypothetical protein